MRVKPARQEVEEDDRPEECEALIDAIGWVVSAKQIYIMHQKIR